MLTVHAHGDEGPHFPFEDVLVTTDGSEAATAAVEDGVDLASNFGSTLHGVSVIDSRSWRFARRSGSIREHLAEQAETAVETVDSAATDAGVDEVRAATPTGVPHRQILDYADEHGVDVIVMGTHGRAGLQRYLLGSVAGNVVRSSTVPVMTVRQMPDEG